MFWIISEYSPFPDIFHSLLLFFYPGMPAHRVHRVCPTKLIYNPSFKVIPTLPFNVLKNPPVIYYPPARVQLIFAAFAFYLFTVIRNYSVACPTDRGCIMVGLSLARLYPRLSRRYRNTSHIVLCPAIYYVMLYCAIAYLELNLFW